jgi:hypothetical protein
MPKGPASWVLLAAVILFVLFMLVKLRVPLTGPSERVEAKRRLGDVKQRVRDAHDDPQGRARALREAANVALEELGQPNLAASYARRAERADPEDTSAVHVLAVALRRANRYRALEKLLWRRLANAPPGPVYERAFEELLSLYEGPMRRRAQAKVLRELRARAGEGQGAAG